MNYLFYIERVSEFYKVEIIELLYNYGKVNSLH